MWSSWPSTSSSPSAAVSAFAAIVVVVVVVVPTVVSAFAVAAFAAIVVVVVVPTVVSAFAADSAFAAIVVVVVAPTVVSAFAGVAIAAISRTLTARLLSLPVLTLRRTPPHPTIATPRTLPATAISHRTPKRACRQHAREVSHRRRRAAPAPRPPVLPASA